MNLLKNSSFELLDDEGIPVGWNASSKGSRIFVESKGAHHGEVCVHFRLEGTETRLDQAKFMTLHPGKSYTLSAFVKTENLQPANGFQLQVINVGWSFGYQSMLPLEATTTGWARYTKTFVVPPAEAFKYGGIPNVQYQVVMYANNARGSVWVDALQFEENDSVTSYQPREGGRQFRGPGAVDRGVTVGKVRDFERAKYFHVQNPLFHKLLGSEPGPDRVLYYGYNDLWSDSSYRPYAKKFGYRYVLAEQEKELRSHPFIPMTNGWPRGGVGSYPTARMILRPDAQDISPGVFDSNPWIMDPRWQDAYIKAAVKLAEQSLDRRPENSWGNTWALWAGDEVFESAGLKVVPRERRYPEVQTIDREIREKFGFGRYGMPESPEDANPFARIAFGRWVNARLTETYRKTHGLVRKINPSLKLLGPDPCGAVPPVDLESMTPYFDIMTNQSWCAPSPFTQQLATGADTKAAVDLSACPVWALVQHTTSSDPEALREQYSQVFRNGGQGLVVLGVEWYDRELEHPKFINPDKWRGLLEITDTVAKMNKLRLPKPDTALLYSSDTMLTLDIPKMADAEHPQMYSAYTALGPCVGSWFSFVSDRQIDRGTRNLKNYKALYIPFATYERGAVLNKVEQFIRNGGLVVCADPTAFTWDINGDPLGPRWEKITGVKRGKTRPGDTFARVVPSSFPRARAVMDIAFPNPGIDLSPTDASVKPLALYPDGSIAATIRKYGRGHVITFSSNPFASTDRDSQLTELVKQIQLFAGAAIGHEIWRFKLPPFRSIATVEAGTHFCLTNNHVAFDGEDVKPSRNLNTGGRYTYNRFPSGFPDAALAGQISFDQGHLTNRKQAYATRKRGGDRSAPSLEKWIVSWSDRQPVAITFDFNKTYALDRMKLFYSGALPEMRVKGSMDGRSWETLGSQPEQDATADVLDLAVPIKGACRYVRVELAERRSDAPMELAEVEVWGTEVK